jgi:transcriptional regulator with XRE-family HTH domain
MKSEFQMEIINQIRKLREQRGYSQVSIAALLGISNGQMGNIESLRCKHKYTLAQIFQICTEFKYPIEHLFLSEEDYRKNTDIINLLISKIVRYEQ